MQPGSWPACLGQGGELGAGAQIEFAEGSGEVAFDGSSGVDEVVGDLLVGHALAEELGDVSLGLGELTQRVGRRGDAQGVGRVASTR
jgi:hypothetical protein